MMNEGLDALATLASTSPSAPAWGDSGLSNNNYASQRINENSFSAHGTNGNTQASTSSGSTAAPLFGSHPQFSTSNLMQMLQNGSLSQLQQALQQCGNGMNPSDLSNSNLALLMGMQQRQPQPQADQLSQLQQQLSYYRCNMNSQSGNQMNAGTGDREGQQANTTSFEPHQALALSQALQAHQRAQQNGKSLIAARITFRGLEDSSRRLRSRPSSVIIFGCSTCATTDCVTFCCNSDISLIIYICPPPLTWTLLIFDWLLLLP
jgi:hypothetical protein